MSGGALNTPLFLVLPKAQSLHLGFYKEKKYFAFVFTFLAFFFFFFFFVFTSIESFYFFKKLQRQECFYFSKTQHFDFIFIASQRFTHPTTSIHRTPSVGRIDMWLTPRYQLSERAKCNTNVL